MPETYDDMIECDTCGDWYHLKCVGLKTIPEEMKSGTVLNVKSDSSNFFKLVVSHIVASPHYLLASKFCMGAPNSLGNFAWGGGWGGGQIP